MPDNQIEEMISNEIRDFPKEKLPDLVKLIHFLRSEWFVDYDSRKDKIEKTDIEKIRGSFKGYLSSSEEFSKRKIDEKEIER
jgi:hypothetical protein